MRSIDYGEAIEEEQSQPTQAVKKDPEVLKEYKQSIQSLAVEGAVVPKRRGCDNF